MIVLASPAGLTKWVLGLLLACASLAQGAAAQVPPGSDSERAKRDAEKVFSFIRFHAVKRAAAPKPAAAPRPAVTAPKRAAAAAPAPAAAPDAVVEPVAATAGPAPAATASPEPVAAAQPAAAGAAEPAALAPAAPASDEADDELETEEPVEIQLRDFVAPTLSPALLSSLGASTPKVRLRFTVQADGRVSAVAARPGTPRRLGLVAERALSQWRFEPIAAARQVEVELLIRRD